MATQFFGRENDEEEGEFEEVEGEFGEEMEETEDGGVILKMREEEEEDKVQDFYANIAPDFPMEELNELALRLLEDIDRDKKSREKRDKQYEEAIKRTGLGKEAPGGADFEGSSKAVHPMLTEACVDFSARAVKELLPPNGPVKTYVPGEDPTTERLEKADRKKDYMNWQFLVQMPGFRAELEQLLTQLPLGGSQYLRLVWDARKKRPVPVFVAIDDVYLPYAATNFTTAERVTYAEYITKYEFEQRVGSGMYMDVGEIVTSQLPEQTKPQQATDKIEGKSTDYTYNEDGLRVVYEICLESDLEGDDFLPYRITIDGSARKIVAINRNWNEEDESQEAMPWMVEFPFVPWRGAYSIGLGQMIGSLAGGATGALRALLDAAHIQNMPTLLKLKGANFSGQSKELNVAEVTEIEGGIASDDVRKLMMPVPFNPPSPVLFQLLGFLVDAGRGLVQTTFERLSEQNPNMPVGTTLALIEEGMKVMSAIHARLYHSMGELLKILHRINMMYLTDEEVKDDIGEVLAQRSDFQLPLDVVPIADPQVFSDIQRNTQLELISQRAAERPDLYNARKIEERILERTKIPNPDELLLPEQGPEEQNAVNENAAMTLKRPVSAFPEQDHLAHLQVHLDYLTSPLLGSSKIIAPTFIPMCIEHVKEHISLWYVTATFELLKQTTGKDDEQMGEMLKFDDPETRSEMDRFLAAASQKIVPSAANVLGGIPPVIEQAMQVLQQLSPDPQPQIPIDPNQQAALQQREQSDARKDQTQKELAQLKTMQEEKKQAADVQKDQQKTQLEFKKMDQAQRLAAINRADEKAQQAKDLAASLRELQLKESAEDKRSMADRLNKEQMNTDDNMTALAIAKAEMESGEKVAIETGSGINPNP